MALDRVRAEPPPLIDAGLAISYLIAASGNTKLAAVRVGAALKQEVSEAQLLASIANDPNSLTALSTQMRLLAIVNAIDAFRLTHAAYIERLSHLSPKEIAHTYTDLLKAMPALANGPPPSTPDPYDTILRTLPPDVADAVEFFIKKKDTPEKAELNSPGSPDARGANRPRPVTSEDD